MNGQFDPNVTFLKINHHPKGTFSWPLLIKSNDQIPMQAAILYCYM